MKLSDNIYLKNKDIAWRAIDGSAYLVDSKGNALHELNEVGTRIWELIDGKKDQDDIVACICDEFDAAKESVKKDLSIFLAEIQKKGLVKEK